MHDPTRTYEASSLGRLQRSARCQGTVGATPRPHGLGIEALNARAPRALSGEALRAANPTIYDEGVRAMVVFPIFAGREVGLIYVHYSSERELNEAELFWVRFLVDRASHAIRCATAYAGERDRRYQLIGQLKTTKALFQAVPESSVVMERLIAGNMQNVAAADLVLLFRTADRIAEPCFSGKRLGPAHDARHLFPFVSRIVKSGEGRILNEKDFSTELYDAEGFIGPERVLTLVALPLKQQGRVAAVLVLVHRRQVVHWP